MAQSFASLAPNRDVEVMVIEDELRLRDLLQQVLKGWGFIVTAARSGEEAIHLMEKGLPDIAIIDLNLPGMGGLELLRSMRLRAKLIQAIVLTGYATVDSAKEAIHLDVLEFLTKPCHLGELERALDRAIRRIHSIPGNGVIAIPKPMDGMTLEEVERQHILAVLAANDGNRTQTALQLGISRRTLYCKIDEYERQGFEAVKSMSRQDTPR